MSPANRINKLSTSVPLMAVLLCTIWPGQKSLAQQSNQGSLYARRGTNQIGATLNRTIQSGGLFARTSSLNSGRASQVGFVNSSFSANVNPFASRGSRQGLGSGVFFQGTRYSNDLRSGSLIRYFGNSGTVRFFSPPAFVGMQRTYPTAPPRFESGNIDFDIRNTNELTYVNAFHHPIALGLQQRALRDEETNDSLLNMPEVTDDLAANASNNMTHAEQLRRRITSVRKKQIDKAWELLKEGSYHQSRKAFQRAGSGIEEELDPKLGAFISAVADRQFQTAVVQLQSLWRHNPEMFAAQYPLGSILPTSRDGERLHSECAALVSSNPKSAEFAAIQAFVLWLDADSPVKQNTAIKAASRLRDEFRVSEYAGFLDKLQEVLDERDAKDNASAGAIG